MNKTYSINFLAREQRLRRWIRRALAALGLVLACGALFLAWQLVATYHDNEALMLSQVASETIPIKKTRARLMAITNTLTPLAPLADVLHPCPLSALITNVVSKLKDDALHLRLIEFKLTAACKWEVKTVCSIPDTVGHQQMVDAIAGYVSNRLAGVSIEPFWPAQNKSLPIVFRGEWPVIRKPPLTLPQTLDELWKVVVEHRKEMRDYKRKGEKQSYIQACVDALNNVPQDRRGKEFQGFVIGIQKDGVDNPKTAIDESTRLCREGGASNAVVTLDAVLREWDGVSRKPWQFKRMQVYKQRLQRLKKGQAALSSVTTKISLIESNMAAIAAGSAGWLSFDDYLKERKLHAVYASVIGDRTWRWTIAEVLTPAAGPFTPVIWNLGQVEQAGPVAAGEIKGIGQPVPLAEVIELIKTIESQPVLALIREAEFAFDQGNPNNVRQVKIGGIVPVFDPAVREKMTSLLRKK